LHQAAGNSHNRVDLPARRRFGKEIVELLIAKGADVNAKSEYETTPLHPAAYMGQKEIVELLIAKGADVNAMDDFGDTPLDGVEKVNNWNTPEDKVAKNEITDLLRKHGGKTSEELKAEGK
jgi:ankyrin repeat protein